MTKNHLVYETPAPGGKKYVGYTKSKPGETGREAVDDRLKEHISARDDLGKLIKANPERAMEKTKIRNFASKEAALQAEQDSIAKTPAAKRINKQ